MFRLNDLVENLHLEQLDRHLFRGTSLPLPLPHVFGGQVLAQALNAAARTVDSERSVHSLHAYFLRPGDISRPIIYDVDPIRDGGSFSTRRVVAKQDGKAIYNCSTSFQKFEKGLEHQMDLPVDVPGPESLEGLFEYRQRLALEHNVESKGFSIPSAVVDIRSPYEFNPYKPAKEKPVKGYWFKFGDGLTDDPLMQQALLAYLSDMEFMSTGMLPHGISFLTGQVQGASLDHSMWFHCPIDLQGWHYYHMDSPWSGNARDFNRGSIYTREGVLVASTAQEGLIRVRD